MTTINLKDHYPWYTEDSFVEVTDEIAALFERFRLDDEAARIRAVRAGPHFSLDANDGIEADALKLPERPDEALERKELEQMLHDALAQLTEAQRRRVLANVIGGLSQQQIAVTEETSQPAVNKSIRRGLALMEKYLKKYD